MVHDRKHDAMRRHALPRHPPPQLPPSPARSAPSPLPLLKPRCAVHGSERKFRSLVSSIFATNGLVLGGSIINSGAQNGGEACFLADLAPHRIIHAVEPLPYAKAVHGWGRNNIIYMQAALGSMNRTVDVGKTKKIPSGSQLFNVDQAPTAATDGPLITARGRHTTGYFRVRRLDDLFAREWAGERFAFGLLDMEGSEADALRGAEATIRRDRPVFSVEVGTGRPANETLPTIHALDYRTFVVEEACGIPMCRNVLCFPSERLPPPTLLNLKLLQPGVA